MAALGQFVEAVGLSGRPFALVVQGYVLGQFGLLYALEHEGAWVSGVDSVLPRCMPCMLCVGWRQGSERLLTSAFLDRSFHSFRTQTKSRSW